MNVPFKVNISQNTYKPILCNGCGGNHWALVVKSDDTGFIMHCTVCDIPRAGEQK